MMLDSGASMTVLDTAFARKIGVKGDRHAPIAGASGSIPGEIASNVSVGVGGLMMDGSDVIIMDLSPDRQGDRPADPGNPRPRCARGRAGHHRFPEPLDAVRSRRSTSERRPCDQGRASATTVRSGRSRSPSPACRPSTRPSTSATAGRSLLAKSYWSTASLQIASLHGAETQIGGVGGMKIARKVTLPRSSSPASAEGGAGFPERGPGGPPDRGRQPRDRNAQAVRSDARLCQ